MSAITLEAVKARHDELGAMIEQLQRRAALTLVLPEVVIDLQPGERYAGPVLDADGQIQHHLILLPAKPGKRLDWDDANTWAEASGGSLPTRQEQALLFANLKAEFEPAWHWSSQEHEDDASCAWYCLFGYGGQHLDPKSFEGCARAVRRLVP